MGCTATGRGKAFNVQENTFAEFVPPVDEFIRAEQVAACFLCQMFPQLGNGQRGKICPLFLQCGLFGYLFQQRNQTNEIPNQKYKAYASKKQNQPEHGGSGKREPSESSRKTHIGPLSSLVQCVFGSSAEHCGVTFINSLARIGVGHQEISNKNAP